MENETRKLLAGYVDGELSQTERAAFETELERDPGLRVELKEFRKLKEVTDMVRYADLPDSVWESYWESLYRKTERGLGWIFFSLGAITLFAFGLWEALSQLFVDPHTPLWVKLGVGGVGVGSAFLLVSFGRERFFAYKRDRYSEVQK